MRTATQFDKLKTGIRGPGSQIPGSNDIREGEPEKEGNQGHSRSERKEAELEVPLFTSARYLLYGNRAYRSTDGRRRQSYRTELGLVR